MLLTGMVEFPMIIEELVQWPSELQTILKKKALYILPSIVNLPFPLSRNESGRSSFFCLSVAYAGMSETDTDSSDAMTSKDAKRCFNDGRLFGFLDNRETQLDLAIVFKFSIMSGLRNPA